MNIKLNGFRLYRFKILHASDNSEEIIAWHARK